MAILPVLQASTVTAIHAAREAAHKDFDSIGLSISELGSDCDRALWYSFRWASAPEKKTGKQLRRFETGNIEERRLIDDLRRIPGIKVIDIDPTTGKQRKVYALGGHLRGKLDAIAFGLPEAPKKWHVVECKATNDKTFKEIQKKGGKVAKVGHYRQYLIYMGETGIDRALYIVSNTNTDDIHAERFEFDPAEFLTLKARIERVIRAGRAPSRIAEDASKYPCILCRHRDVCHGDEFGRNHCRTCINSTPIIKENSTEATWRCEKHAKDLTVDEQRTGCGSQLYIPDVVPGEQIDATDESVTYRMRDGSTWVDQFHPPREHVLDTNGTCTVCGGVEVSPTECPGVRIGEERAAEVIAGRLDFVRGQWIEKFGVES